MEILIKVIQARDFIREFDEAENGHGKMYQTQNNEKEKWIEQIQDNDNTNEISQRQINEWNKKYTVDDIIRLHAILSNYEYDVDRTQEDHEEISRSTDLAHQIIKKDDELNVKIYFYIEQNHS